MTTSSRNINKECDTEKAKQLMNNCLALYESVDTWIRTKDPHHVKVIL